MYAKLIIEQGEYRKKDTGEYVSLLTGDIITTPGGLVTDSNLQGFVKCNSVEEAELMLNICKAEDYSAETKLIRITYTLVNKSFAILDNKQKLYIATEEDVIDYKDLYPQFKVLCSNIKSDWSIIEWYEPNILALDGVEYQIMMMDDMSKYLIWRIGEMCKGRILGG